MFVTVYFSINQFRITYISICYTYLMIHRKSVLTVIRPNHVRVICVPLALLPSCVDRIEDRSPSSWSRENRQSSQIVSWRSMSCPLGNSILLYCSSLKQYKQNINKHWKNIWGTVTFVYDTLDAFYMKSKLSLTSK